MNYNIRHSDDLMGKEKAGGVPTPTDFMTLVITSINTIHSQKLQVLQLDQIVASNYYPGIQLDQVFSVKLVALVLFTYQQFNTEAQLAGWQRQCLLSLLFSPPCQFYQVSTKYLQVVHFVIPNHAEYEIAIHPQNVSCIINETVVVHCEVNTMLEEVPALILKYQDSSMSEPDILMENTVQYNWTSDGGSLDFTIKCNAANHSTQLFCCAPYEGFCSLPVFITITGENYTGTIMRNQLAINFIFTTDVPSPTTSDQSITENLNENCSCGTDNTNCIQSIITATTGTVAAVGVVVIVGFITFGLYCNSRNKPVTNYTPEQTTAKDDGQDNGQEK